MRKFIFNIYLEGEGDTPEKAWESLNVNNQSYSDYQELCTDCNCELEECECEIWICTDPSCQQHRLNISETVFKFREDRIKNPVTKEKYLYESEIDLADYTRDEILNHCSAFYTTKEINKWIDDQSNNALLAECIFEMED